MTDITEYGHALFQLAEEDGEADKVFSDIECLMGAINENPEYTRLISCPVITKEERNSLLDTAFSSLNENLVNMVKLLFDRHLSHKLDKALYGFFNAYYEAKGIERVEAITALPMSSEQKTRLKNKLESVTGKTVILTNTVDKETLGGIKIRYSSNQIDATVRSKLDKIENSLKNVVI